MPKLSKLEFAELVRSMPGASDDDIIAAAKQREAGGAAGEASLDRLATKEIAAPYADIKPDPKPRSATLQMAANLAGAPGVMLASKLPESVRNVTDAVAAPAMRVAPAVLGSVAGSAFGPAGTIAGGALGAGLGELGAEGMEVQTGARENFNPAQIGVQSALGAVPVFGKAGSMGKAALNYGAQGALLGGAGAVGTQLAETGELPSMEQVALSAGVGAGLGAAGGALPHAVNSFTGADAPPVNKWDDADLFTDPTQSPLADGSDFGIVTWAKGQPDDASRIASLEQELRKRGHNPIPQRGVFDGEEASFLVPGLTSQEAKELGRMGDQISVISREGYHRLADDATYPSQGLQFDQTTDNYYSEIQLPGGRRAKYQMAYPDEAFGPPAATSQSPAALDAQAPAAQSEAPSTSAQGSTEQPFGAKPDTRAVTPMAGDVPPEFHAVEAPAAKADNGLGTAAAIAAPAGAMAIPDDPDSEWDDWARVALMGTGVVGAAAHFPKGLKKQLDSHIASMKAANPDIKEAQIETGLFNFLREKFQKDGTPNIDKVNHAYGTYRTIELPTDFEGVNFDKRYPITKLLKIGRDKAPEFNTISRARIMKAYEMGSKVGSEWGTTEHLGRLTRNDPQAAMEIARMWGAFSPGTDTGTNAVQGIEGFIRAILRGESPRNFVRNMKTAGTRRPSAVEQNVERVQKGGRIFRKKTEALAAGEVGLNDLPIDLWFLRALGANTEKSPPAGVYEAIKTAADKMAKETGEDLFPFMAKVWTGMQHIAGAPTPSFSKAIARAGVPPDINHPAVADWFMDNARTIGKRVAGRKSKQGGDTPPPSGAPEVYGMNRYSDEDFTKQLQKLFAEARAKGDVLGKVRTTKGQNAADVQLLEQVMKALGLDTAESAKILPFQPAKKVKPEAPSLSLNPMRTYAQAVKR